MEPVWIILWMEVDGLHLECVRWSQWFKLVHRNNIASSNKPAWCGNSNGWINSSYTLVPLNGFTRALWDLGLCLHPNDSTQADGFSIDDFFIDPAPALDAGIESVIFPLPFAMENNFWFHSGAGENYGAGPINSMNISYSLDGGVPISQTWNGNLLPAETDTFRFSTYGLCNQVSIPCVCLLHLQVMLQLEWFCLQIHWRNFCQYHSVCRWFWSEQQSVSW